MGVHDSVATIDHARYTADNCSIGRTLEIIGERWTILVLRESFFGVRRFDEFQRNLGIARNILAARLQTLVGAGLLERRRYQERPERFEYRLTQKGRDMYPAMIAIKAWGDKHAADPEGPSVTLMHGDHEFAPDIRCAECGEVVEARDISPIPGPGAKLKAVG
jgi:DNA-binding HxlR family transcriptional regulator